MNEKNFLKEIQRDFVAIGGPVFFALVLARVLIISDYQYLMQFLFAGILFFILIYLAAVDVIPKINFLNKHNFIYHIFLWI